MPDLVVADPSTGINSVKYANIVAPLIESTKELYGMCVANAEDMEKIEENVNKNSRQIASLKEELNDVKEQNLKLIQENNMQNQELLQLKRDMEIIQTLLKK